MEGLPESRQMEGKDGGGPSRASLGGHSQCSARPLPFPQIVLKLGGDTSRVFPEATGDNE